jgi:two-component system CheB/CheR fusion protein
MKNGKTKSIKPVKKNITLKKDTSQFPIIGIGASAGGLEALEQFFENMPKDTGMAFVVIQHLDSNHIGIMPELLQRITQMRVAQASDGLKVKPNFVYVIPPNKSMSLLNGSLHLFDPVETRGLRLPIDIFFRSLANDMHEKSIGIILSGMGSDGSRGLKAIKEENGMVLVQEPATAKFDGMPNSAIEAVIADIVAPARELPVKLITYLKFIPNVKADPIIESKIKSNLEKIIILLRDQSGHDFSLYKKNTLFRRIERRKSIHQIEKIDNYVRFLQENPKEVEILFKELLIGVTSFFRDNDVWELLRDSIFPDMIEELPDGYVLRAWVPGCSTGEEAYSLAIVFKEAMGENRNHKNLSLQIFATDLDRDAIEVARKGNFSKNITTDVSPERINRFFTVNDETYRVNGSIRETIVFAPQNVIKDPPFTKIDFLSCRNMLIYMEPVLQKKLMDLFHYSLNPGGIMLLGTAETLGTNDDGFTEINAKLKFFKRAGGKLTNELIDFPSSFYNTKEVRIEKEILPKAIDNIQTLADQILLQRFSPASVLVNDRGDILYITGHTGKYLEPIAGKANWNIYAMAREGLRNELPTAFRKAMQNFDPVILRNIKVGTNQGKLFVDVTVQRIEGPESVRGMVVVVFADVPAVVEHDAVNPKTGKRRPTSRQKEMEIELQRSNEELQSTREEMQTSQEELKSINEELQSTNEEMQSTNEELTTSKEEMQSMNEELQMVNIEMQSKISNTARTNDDMKNLLISTDIATLFLDKKLNIRMFTNSAKKVIKLRETDIGRPFSDLVIDLNYPEIESHSWQVIKTLISVETLTKSKDGRWFTVRIMPYRTIDDHIDGVVILAIDITNFKKMELELNELKKDLKIMESNLLVETHFRRLFESAIDGILVLDAETGIIIDVNPSLIRILGYTKEELLKKAIWEIGLFKDIVDNKERFSELQNKEFIRYKDLPLETVDGRKINVEFISTIYLMDRKRVIQCEIREI